MNRVKKKVLWLLTLVALFLSSTYYLWYENNAIEVTQYEKIIDNLPSTFKGFKILQIADLQSKKYRNNNEELIQLIDKSQPDMIVITGDLFDRRRMEEAQNSIDFIAQINSKYPVFYVSGNHECWSGQYTNIISALIEMDVVVLDNTYTIINNGNEIIKLFGLIDPAHYYPEKGKEYEKFTGIIEVNKQLDWMSKEGSDVPAILLSHRPELVEVYRLYDFDLILSGHAHGGQVQLPKVGGLWAPGQGFLPEFEGGYYDLNDKTTLIVSRGLGNSSFPFRINNHPELVEITLN
ncbi:metallophosphoesterase [Vallitalea okinawensis]|uniref:metallophosphoesterase n=1 Tax=Vallitalea okinawensis TaxID=2078660 RepID=UPI000CFA94DE|nr:metallophosphoesterase [Vallitalea okinawensis]